MSKRRPDQASIVKHANQIAMEIVYAYKSNAIDMYELKRLFDRLRNARDNEIYRLSYDD